MPYYNFRCKICKYEFEAKIGMFDNPPVCPECENETEKFFNSVPNTKFVGSGFATNDLKDNLERDEKGRIKDVMPDTKI